MPLAQWLAHSSYHYVENVNSNLICCICRAPFVDPVITRTCSHTFCRGCIMQSLERRACCPVDRSPLTQEDLRPENMLFRNMVEELIVECPQRAAGCSYTCQRQLVRSHIKEDCLYVEVKCSEDGCHEMVLRRDAGPHAHGCAHKIIDCEACGSPVRATDLELHAATCVGSDVKCDFCSAEMRRSDLAKHNEVCDDYLISCTHAHNGCPWTGPRHSLPSTHLPQCPYETIKGFFAINDARMSSLRDENSILKCKVLDLESGLAALKRDLDVARRALGPWWRTDEPLPLQSDVPEDAFLQFERPPPQYSGPNRRTPNPLSAILALGPDGVHPEPREAHYGSYSDPSFLAQYFPPAHDEIGEEFSPVSPISPSQRPSEGGRRLSAGPPDGVFSPRVVEHANGPRPNLQLAVAQMDVNTSLEGSLHSIRDMVVSLSASLDSLRRRQEIALTTENLRMNEEVGALRAVVHGLRMQVHSIMMERHNSRSGDGLEWTTSTQYYNQTAPVAHPIMIPTTTTSVTKL